MTRRFTTRRAMLAQTASAALWMSAGPVSAQVWDPITLDLPPAGEVAFYFQGGPAVLRRLSAAERAAYLSDTSVVDAPLHRGPLSAALTPVPATPDEILQGPEKDLLVLVLVCMNKGCVVMADQGDFADQRGYFCACFGSHYDGLGRIRSGPATRNLYSPELVFTWPNTARITPRDESIVIQ